MTPQPNHIAAAIEALHSAFVPKEVGTPQDFGTQEPTPTTARVLSDFNNRRAEELEEKLREAKKQLRTWEKPKGLLEAVVESVSFYSETEQGTTALLVSARLSGFHVVPAKNVAQLLLESIEEGLAVQDINRVSLTPKGSKVATLRGWSEPVEVLVAQAERELEEKVLEDQITEEVSASILEGGRFIITPERAKVLLDGSARALIAFIVDHDSYGDLITLEQAERSWRARKTVLTALQVRLQELLPTDKEPEPTKVVTLSSPPAMVPHNYNPTRRFRPSLAWASPEPVVIEVTAVQGDAEKAIRAKPVQVPTEPEPIATLDGQPIFPRIPRYNPDSSEAEVIGYLLAEVSALRGLVAAQGAEIASLRSSKPAPAPKVVRESSPKVDGEQVEIGTVEPGTFLQPARGSVRLLVRRNGSIRVAYFNNTGSPRIGYAPADWKGVPVIPSLEERTALYSVLSPEERSSLGV